jgi:hypothetical protein
MQDNPTLSREHINRIRSVAGCVRDFWTDEDKVAVTVGGYVVSDESLPAVVQRKREFVLAVVMPLEPDCPQSSIKESQRTFLRGGCMFEIRLECAYWSKRNCIRSTRSGETPVSVSGREANMAAATMHIVPSVPWRMS